MVVAGYSPLPKAYLVILGVPCRRPPHFGIYTLPFQVRQENMEKKSWFSGHERVFQCNASLKTHTPHTSWYVPCKQKSAVLLVIKRCTLRSLLSILLDLKCIIHFSKPIILPGKRAPHEPENTMATRIFFLEHTKGLRVFALSRKEFWITNGCD